LFEYIDIQKLRTPKGLAWLKSQYPSLTQNELMMEMQAIRMMHCRIWSEGVREIVSAADSAIKFIISDHPVTVFNPGAPPGSKTCTFPQEPGIELKGTQTLFPLDRNHCLILTNLEFAEDPAANPLSKRIFARRFGTSLVRNDAFICSRKLTSEEVEAVNRIIRSRAHRYVAAGEKAWLPEPITNPQDWKKIGEILLPPSNELFGFGGEILVRYENGEVYYQDAFGRTEKERNFIKKTPIKDKLKPCDPCGCGSGKDYADCCKHKPVHLRPSWDEISIRERNLILLRYFEDILEFRLDKDWTEFRKSITDEKISKIYSSYEMLWPLETDLLALLPKPDGTARAIYTGVLDTSKIIETAGLGTSLLFDELLIQHPFINPRMLKKEVNPVTNPKAYRQEVLKSVSFFMQVIPLVKAGIVNLFPSPEEFDFHLHQQTMQLAKERWRYLEPLMHIEHSEIESLVSHEFLRILYHLSENNQRAMIKKHMPDIKPEEIEIMLERVKICKKEDPFAVLQEGTYLDNGEGVTQIQVLKLLPNFEMAMYVAQATEAVIITDHPARWEEILFTIRKRDGDAAYHLSDLTKVIGSSRFSMAQHICEISKWKYEKRPQPHVSVLRGAYRYLSRVDMRGMKRNYEQRLVAQFTRAHKNYEIEIKKAGFINKEVRIQCAFPKGGLYDSTITRLLLMSSSEHHVRSVPMAFYMDARPATPTQS